MLFRHGACEKNCEQDKKRDDKRLPTAIQTNMYKIQLEGMTLNHVTITFLAPESVPTGNVSPHNRLSKDLSSKTELKKTNESLQERANRILGKHWSTFAITSSQVRTHNWILVSVLIYFFIILFCYFIRLG